MRHLCMGFMNKGERQNTTIFLPLQMLLYNVFFRLAAMAYGTACTNGSRHCDFCSIYMVAAAIGSYITAHI